MNFFLLAVISLIILPSRGQNIDAKYMRMTEASIFLNYPDQRIQQILTTAVKMDVGDVGKVNHFKLPIVGVESPNRTEVPYEIPGWSNRFNKVFRKKFVARKKSEYGAVVLQKLEGELNLIGRNYVGHWMNIDKNGVMSEQRIFESSKYTATAAEFYLDSITGKSKIHDLANSLLDNSYMIIYDVRDFKSQKEIYDAIDLKNSQKTQPIPPQLRKEVGYNIGLKIYLFKLKWDLDTSFYSLYDNFWIGKKDDSYVQSKKRQLFNNSKWNFELLGSSNYYLTQTNDFYDEYVETETKARDIVINSENKIEGVTPPVRKNKTITSKEYVDYGYLAYQKRLYYVAAKNYENALRLSPSDSNVKKSLANVYLEMGDREYQNRQYHYAKQSWKQSQRLNLRSKTDFKSRFSNADMNLVPILQKIEAAKYQDMALLQAILDRFPEQVNKSGSKVWNTNPVIEKGLMMKTSIVSIDGTKITVPIGTKENIKPGNEFTIFQVIENKDKIKERSPIGYCRVSNKVGNNIGLNADVLNSNSTSIFRQQSGRIATPGLILEQSKARRFKMLVGYATYSYLVDQGVPVFNPGASMPEYPNAKTARAMDYGISYRFWRDYYASLQVNQFYSTLSVQKEIYTNVSGLYVCPSLIQLTETTAAFGAGFGVGYNWGLRTGMYINYSYVLGSSFSFGLKYRL
jgi:hypothetical protein